MDVRTFHVGWMVFREFPRKLLGPYPTSELAAEIAENLGCEFSIGYGKRFYGADTYLPMNAPQD